MVHGSLETRQPCRVSATPKTSGSAGQPVDRADARIRSLPLPARRIASERRALHPTAPRRARAPPHGTVATFSTPRDLTLEELRIELIFPADANAERFFEELAQNRERA